MADWDHTLNVGELAEAAQQFEAWDKAGGKVVAGLLRRRMALGAKISVLSFELVLYVPLNLFGLTPRTGPRCPAVFPAILCPAEILPAIAPFGKLYPGVLAASSVSDIDRYHGRGHRLSPQLPGKTQHRFSTC